MPAGARRLLLRGAGTSARRALLALCAAIALVAPLSAGAAEDTRDVLSAQYAEPTARYPHGVLGDDLEWGALVLRVDRCPACARPDPHDVLIRLSETRVFEDLAPRVIDLDFDGLREVVVIESDTSLGARLAVYGPEGLITATPFIGRTFRWLAPLGAADLDGDGVTELAYIDRPHLARTLRVWRYENRALTEIASLPGLTNHRIGQAFISGGIRTCAGVPEIITADADWRQIMATRLQNGALRTRGIARFQGPQSLDNAMNCN